MERQQPQVTVWKAVSPLVERGALVVSHSGSHREPLTMKRGDHLMKRGDHMATEYSCYEYHDAEHGVVVEIRLARAPGELTFAETGSRTYRLPDGRECDPDGSHPEEWRARPR